MRAACLLVLTLATTFAAAQEKAERYGVALDTKTYPQATPKEALTSVLKAAANTSPLCGRTASSRRCSRPLINAASVSVVEPWSAPSNI